MRVPQPFAIGRLRGMSFEHKQNKAGVHSTGNTEARGHGFGGKPHLYDQAHHSGRMQQCGNLDCRIQKVTVALGLIESLKSADWCASPIYLRAPFARTCWFCVWRRWTFLGRHALPRMCGHAVIWQTLGVTDIYIFKKNMVKVGTVEYFDAQSEQHGNYSTNQNVDETADVAD